MMHPQEFVAIMLAKGRKNEVAEMIWRFLDDLKKKKTKEHATLYNFVHIFLFSVACELQDLEVDQELEDNPFLSTWKSLGMYGIDRLEIEKMIKSTEE